MTNTNIYIPHQLDKNGGGSHGIRTAWVSIYIPHQLDKNVLNGIKAIWNGVIYIPHQLDKNSIA